MSPEEAVRTRLLDITAVTDIVTDRIYQSKLPELAPLPAVRVQMISGDASALHLRGGIPWYRSRVQVDAYAAEETSADPYATAVQLGEAIHGDESGSALAAWQGVVAGSPGVRVCSVERVDRRVGYDSEERKDVRVRQDYFVYWKPVR